MTRRSLREDGHYEGVPTELILTSRAFPSCFYFSHRLWNGRRGDYIKSIFGQGMGRRRLGLQASSNNLPAGSAGRDLSLHRHTFVHTARELAEDRVLETYHQSRSA
jgi:hypothetical protein